MNIPSLSIIIPVRDRLEELKRCLNSITHQNYSGQLEVVVVDDGSKEPVNQQSIDAILPFPIRFLRQVPLGISVARNHGIHDAQGNYLLFIDSDCELADGCLCSLLAYIQSHQDPLALQLTVVGHKNTLSGKMFHVRIVATFSRLFEGEVIRIVNTSGFALHRSLIDRSEFFDPRLKRGEDTDILARLIQQKILPQLVKTAVVRHMITASCYNYLIHHFSRGYYTVAARNILAKVAPVLMNPSQKHGVIKTMYNVANAEGISSSVIAFILLAKGFEFLGRGAYRLKHACSKLGVLVFK